MEWGVLSNHITTFSRLTTGLSQLPNYLLTNHKQTKTQRKKRPSYGGDFAGNAFSTRRYANGGLRLRFFNEPQRHKGRTEEPIAR